MSNNKAFILGGLLVLAVVLVAFILRDIIKPKSTATGPAPIIIEEPAPGVSSDDVQPVITDDNDPFRQEAPVITRIPDANEVLPAAQQKEIAVPTVVVPAAPGVDSKFRNFDITAENGNFIPEKIIVQVGDTVHINFAAVDKDYDITFPSYNMKQIAKQGQTKILEFQAVQDGSFLYYCESCGGAEGTTKGNIIIVK